jgi:hypothetical protein
MHWISGLVAPLEALEAIGAAHDIGRPAPLEFGLGFLPLDDENLDTIVPLAEAPERNPDADDGEDWNYLFPALIDWCAAQSKATRLAYIETQYWGGTGGQGAAVFDGGATIWGPELGDGLSGPVSTALAMLGVTKGAALDEFEAAGIPRQRSNEGWRAESL